MRAIRRYTALNRSVLVVVLLVAPCVAAAEWHEQSADIMGTRVRAELWHADPVTAARLLQQVMDEMQRIDAVYSTYKPDSDLSRLNGAAGKGWVSVTPEMLLLLERSAPPTSARAVATARW